MWTTARITVYLASFLGGGAMLLAAWGHGTYDHATGMFDLAAFNVNTLAVAIVTLGGNGLAALAAVRGWGRR